MTTPPHDIDAERSLLGALLLAGDRPPTGHEQLTPQDFYHPPHRAIFAAILVVEESGEPIDTITVCAQISASGQLEHVGGSAYVAPLTDLVITGDTVEHYARIVLRCAKGRALQTSLRDLAARAHADGADYDQVLSAMASSAADVSCKGTTDEGRSIGQIVKDVHDNIGTATTPSGWATGFASLDKVLSGLSPGTLNILAARPGMGKTALALQIGIDLARTQGARGAFFSLEMPEIQIGQRALASRARVSLNRIRRGDLMTGELDALTNASNWLWTDNLQVYDRAGMTINDMRAVCRRAGVRGGLDFVLVDYMQLMPMTGQGNMHERLGEISKGLVRLAREHGIPVIALSQLNRSVEQRQDKRPMVSDLRESGSLEEDAYSITFVYREGYYNAHADQGTAEVIVAKNRNGPTGIVKLGWEGKHTRFFDLP